MRTGRYCRRGRDRLHGELVAAGRLLCSRGLRWQAATGPDRRASSAVPCAHDVVEPAVHAARQRQRHDDGLPCRSRCDCVVKSQASCTNWPAVSCTPGSAGHLAPVVQHHARGVEGDEAATRRGQRHARLLLVALRAEARGAISPSLDMRRRTSGAKFGPSRSRCTWNASPGAATPRARCPPPGHGNCPPGRDQARGGRSRRQWRQRPAHSPRGRAARPALRRAGPREPVPRRRALGAPGEPGPRRRRFGGRRRRGSAVALLCR
jgi:hypothetical protein